LPYYKLFSQFFQALCSQTLLFVSRRSAFINFYEFTTDSH